MLLAKSNIASDKISILFDRFAMDDCITVSRHQHAGQHINGGRLSSAIVAQQRDDFILLYADRHLIDSTELSELFCHRFEQNRVSSIIGASGLALAMLDRRSFLRALILIWNQKLLLRSPHLLVKRMLVHAAIILDLVAVKIELLLVDHLDISAALAEAVAAGLSHSVGIRDDSLQVDMQEVVDGAE